MSENAEIGEKGPEGIQGFVGDVGAPGGLFPNESEVLADTLEADSGVLRPKKVTERRPAELGTFVAGVVMVAAGLGFDVDGEVILAGFVVLALLPAIISYFVTLYRESLFGEPPTE